jgi:hypothetical protein
METPEPQGLGLCHRYYMNMGRPMLTQRFGDYVDRIAAGLVGDGSECFGFDDEISRDHDWGPGFCLWLIEPDYIAVGTDLQALLDALPQTFAGRSGRKMSVFGQNRTGVFEIGRFYRRFIGLSRPPETLEEWRRIPESYLAAATNGQVFSDPLGAFSAFREKLLAFYPEDIRLRMIASRCMTMAQAGQYNYSRCLKRREYVASHRAEAQFIDASISVVFLLNRRYKPYYKWMHRAVRGLPVLGSAIHRLTDELVTCQDRHHGVALYRQKAHLIERICGRVIAVLKDQGLSEGDSDFLLDHGPRVHSRIQDPSIRDLDLFVP